MSPIDQPFVAAVLWLPTPIVTVCNGLRELLLTRHHKIVHAHGIRAVGQETLQGAPLLVGVTDTNPQQNPAGLNRILKVSGMSRNEPKTKSMLETGCA